MTLYRLVPVVALALAVPMAAGCRSNETELCEAECDCRGCSDRDFDNCLRDYDNDFEKSDRNGCPGLYDELVACRVDTYECRGTDFNTSCNNERDRYKSCVDDD